jgi:hypothetical protein
VKFRSFTRSVGRWYLEANAWPISRPSLQASWIDERQWFIALSWGTPGCDPVWMVEYHRTLGERVGKLVDRWYSRRG